MVVSVRYMELMDQYWGKSKAVYYRRIKRELEMVEESSELSGQKRQQSCQSVEVGGKFKLPDGLRSNQNSFLNDPDATLRHLLTTLTSKEKYKEQTREASQVNEFVQKPVISKTSNKSHTHARTNPSHIGSTSSFKKGSKRRSTQKSVSNDHKKSLSKSKEKKISNVASCKKIGVSKQM